MAEANVIVRAYSDQDEALLFGGLERAASGLRGRSRTRASLRWRYGRAPHGACVALASDREGRIAAGIAATRHRALLEGQEVFFLEVGDLFNDFARGAGLDRARALIAAGKALAETLGGPAPEKHPVMFGLPERRAHRLGLKHLEWEVLRSENVLRASPEALASPAGAGIEIDEVERFPAEIEGPFLRFAQGRGALIVRDPARLNWRYCEHPEHRCEIALARRAGECLGYAVHRDGWIVDWIVPPEERGAAGELLAWSSTRARAAGREGLSLVVPDTAPEWLLFQELGFRVHGLREYLCFRSFQRPAIMSWLFKRWYYTRGDTDRSA